MSNLHVSKTNVRRPFGRIKDVVPVPNLIEIQSKSFNDFVQLDCLPEERLPIGLEKALKDIFPIDSGGQLSLEYVGYELGHWSCTCGKLTGIANRYQWGCSSCKKNAISRLDIDHTCTFCSKKNRARYQQCSSCLTRVSPHMPMNLKALRSSEQTFSMPLKIKIQLINWMIDDAGNKTVQDIKEQDIFFADLPVMVDLYEEKNQFKLGSLGTFLINGVDRVVVSQLHRSPGAVFSQSKKNKDFRGRPYYLARIIPMRGSWVDIEFDSNDILYVRVDKKKKVPVTTFLQALGVEKENIIPLFYDSSTIISKKGYLEKNVEDSLVGFRIEKGMISAEQEKPFLGKRVTKELVAQLKKAGISTLTIQKTSLINKVLSGDVIDQKTGEILFEQGQIFSEDMYDRLKKYDLITFKTIRSSGYAVSPTIATTLLQDRCTSQDEALKELHAKIWPGDSSTLKEIKERFENLFFNERFYDLTKVGRIRMNKKLGLSVSHETTVLTKEDIIETIRYLVNMRERGEGEPDDIDHLGNRRVRLVGELLANQVYLGLLRIERIARERFRMQEIHSALMPQDFLNVKPLSAVLREFFGLGQLSQYMDQTNPLAEIAHKRRLSALGPGGVMKDRATYEVRDVHTSHYGRICPIETPEGQTVGLISSLATYAMVNDLGFIETAYQVVVDSEIKNKVVFLDAFQEEQYYIAQSDIARSANVLQGSIFSRHRGNYLHVEANSVDYIDLSPKQLISVSSALIPFLEHDDASRALMGANMQRQAIPLIREEAPIVGTGMECEIARASGVVVVARCKGVVEYVSSEKIVVRAEQEQFSELTDWLAKGVDTYYLSKFGRSSHGTWIHQTPIVKVGDKVDIGDILSNGQAIDHGELALGANLLVAFMPWHGYNFEDAIVLNQRLVVDDTLTSVHIEEYVVEARDTKLGPEEITRDIPNVSEFALEGLDDDGVVRIGTRVKPGDILVGKVTLKGDIQYSPEEKLLRAIFGEKSREVRDTSLRVSPGVSGTVVEVKFFSRAGVRRDRRYKEEVLKESQKIEKNFQEHLVLLAKMTKDRVKKLLQSEFDSIKIDKISCEDALLLKVSDKNLKEELGSLKEAYENQHRILINLKEDSIAKLKKGDPLPSGVIKMVKVYIAMKRPISAGDKIAGRHGNKGIVSIIVPREDMPCLDDGTPVDIILNPLGVPSRMNVGQILETILGLVGYTCGQRLRVQLDQAGTKNIKKELNSWYGKELINDFEEKYGEEGLLDLARKTADRGLMFRTPVFDGADYDNDIAPLLKELDLPEVGAFKLRDGRTGDRFDQPITVGSMYVMKLDHMVDDKLHARSVGPYSLVTQQPLGGKAQMGGQRLGEMEVWALEAYGAAYTLQEMLTYKSDDVVGRHKVYGDIVRGESISEPGVPESFNVLVKELQSLALRVDLFKSDKEKINE